MTDTLAIILGVLVIGLGIADYSLYGSEHFLFLAKKFVDFTEWMAFWR